MNAKGKGFIFFGLIILLISLLASVAPGQEVFQFQTHKMKLEILPAATFAARFGDNPDVPRTDAGIIALARKLYPPRKDKQPEAAVTLQECREYEVGVLFAALQNPAVSDLTRRQVDSIIQETVPPLPKTYTSGHFTFYYTDSDTDPDHNVTLDQIEATATRLNSYWDTYVANFKTPKNYLSGGTEMVDVYVYYLGPTLLGETNSSWDSISLNSKWTVKDACNRRTTSAHELFHRVQYAYGYISGTAKMKWIVEGTASWSQKYTNQSIRDYMGWMNRGLNAPNINLINSRSYNACHFWVYLQKLVGSWTAIRDVWDAYETNGNNAKAAVNTVTTDELGKTFNQFVQAWVKANYIKDLDNASTGGYEYYEDEVTQTSCEVTYGPLSHVPRYKKAISNNGDSLAMGGTVQPYGAEYYEFTLGKNFTKLQVRFDGADTGNFSYHLIPIKNGAFLTITNIFQNDYTYTKTLTPGQWDKLAVVVAGLSKGGDYQIIVGSGCLTGVYTGNMGLKWYLNHNTNSNAITGYAEGRSNCDLEKNTIWKVTGTYDAPNVTLSVETSILGWGCCNFTCTGQVTSCFDISGQYNAWGGSWCTSAGYWYIFKVRDYGAMEAELAELEPASPCPDCNRPDE
jgi:hypothetical protein